MAWFRIFGAWMLVGLLAPAVLAWAQLVSFPQAEHVYLFLDLPLEGEFGHVFAFDVNGRGQVVGTRNTGLLEEPFFLQATTTVLPLTCASEAIAAPRTLNRSGQVTGTCYGATVQAFVTRADGRAPARLVRVPGATRTVGLGINDSGDLVGVFYDAEGGGPHGWVRRGRRVLVLDVPDSHGTVLQGINTFGVIVGHTTGSDRHTHGVLIADETVYRLDVPGARDTFLWDINDHGHVLGIASFPDGTAASVLWREGGIEGLTVPGPGVLFVDAAGLGPDDQIAGRVLLAQPEDPQQPMVSRGFVAAPLAGAVHALALATAPTLPSAAIQVVLDGCVAERPAMVVPLRLQGLCAR